MRTHHFFLTLFVCWGPLFANAADVEKVVQDATTKAEVATKPTTNTGGKTCALMKASEAGGVDSEKNADHGNAEGNAEKTCDSYISNSGQVGKKGKDIEKQLQEPAYAKIALDDEATGCKDGSGDSESNSGLGDLCPKFCDMSKADRAKAYVKFMGALAKVKTGCGESGKAEGDKKKVAGDFALDYDTKSHSKWGRTFAGSGHNCSATNVEAARENGLCALDMLMDQLRNKDKKEQQAEQGMDEKKKRQVGVFSKNSFWKELNEEDQSTEKAREQIRKEMEQYKPCGGGGEIN